MLKFKLVIFFPPLPSKALQLYSRSKCNASKCLEQSWELKIQNKLIKLTCEN